MSKKNTFRFRVAFAACALVLSADVIADTVTTIDVPAGDLAAALKMVSRQAGVNLVFTADEMKGMKTRGVSGSFTARQAVEKLLEGTSLKLLTDEKTGAMLIAQPDAGKD